MAYYINNSSRRFPQPPQEEMEKSWEEGLGKPTGAVCNVCGQKSYDGKLVNGLCRKCRKTQNRLPFYLIDLSNIKTMDPNEFSRQQRQIIDYMSKSDKENESEMTMEEAMSELDESIKESEERDLNAESSGGYQHDY
jgi:hypothetical protein